MSEAEALQRYDAFLWKQVHAFVRLAKRKSPALLDDLIQEARLAFLQHIRTHNESEWAACTLTIKGALYEYARREYPLSVSHHGFGKALKKQIQFHPIDEYLTALGEWYEDDHTDIDLREALTQISEADKQIVALKLEGMSVKEIASRTGRPPQAISWRLKTIRRKTVA